MLDELKVYLKAVAKHWVGLVAGVIGVILVVVSIAGPRLTRAAGVLLLLGGFSIAQLMAWRDMLKERDAATADRDKIASDWGAERAAQPIIDIGGPHVDL